MTLTKAVIFDLDDTLILERDYALSGFRAVAETFADVLGEPARVARNMARRFDHGDRRRIFNDALAAAGVSEAGGLVRQMVETYRNHVPTLAMTPDARRALARLRPLCRLGVITDGFAAAQANKIRATGVAQLVDKVIITAELGPGFGKPHARAFEMMAGDLGTPHAGCVYVADNPAKDFIAPNRLGWRSVRIIRPEGIYRDTPVAPGGEPGETITSLDELSPVG